MTKMERKDLRDRVAKSMGSIGPWWEWKIEQVTKECVREIDRERRRAKRAKKGTK